ncbi:MAG: hypothetical protein RL758_1930 [Pseudomonadota bacterium]|jgi:heme exporter protein D
MYIVAIAWIYVALMMAVAEAASSQGTLLGAIFTFVLYGLVPVSLIVYVMGTPLRRKQRLRQEAMEREAARAERSSDPDASGHAPGAVDIASTQSGIPAVGKEP